KQEILCDALLKADPSRRIPVVPPEQGIDLQAGKSGKFSDLAAGLASYAFGEQRIGPQIRRGGLFGSLSSRADIDNVDRWTRRNGNIATAKLIDHSHNRHGP